MEQKYTYELYHYGVKGMKWGVRKSDYKTMSKHERAVTRSIHMSKTKAKREERAIGTAIATGVMGLPGIGLIALGGMKMSEARQNKQLKKIRDRGKNYVGTMLESDKQVVERLKRSGKLGKDIKPNYDREGNLANI